MEMWKQSAVLQTAFIAAVTTLVGLSPAQSHKLPNGGEIKALLVAASNTWENYRHQSDICHAYQVLRGNGIPKENIVVMMYDDIAYNEENPHKGVIINRPGGPNVYENIKIDYKGEDVNKKVFFDVLLGNKDAVKGIGSGRVLESGPNDTVFFNYVDHGGSKKLQMIDDLIYASELIKAFKELRETSKFQKMFFYLNTCYSGSVAELIPANLSIFTMTSANNNQSSCSCFQNTSIYPPIAGEFGVHWMRDAETVDLRKETIQQQFLKVKSYVKQSNASEYGNLALGNTKVSEVLGYREHPMADYPIDCSEPVVEYQIPVVMLERKIQRAVNQEEKKKLEEELKAVLQFRDEIVQFFSNLAKEVLTPEKMNLYEETISWKVLTKPNLACYEDAILYIHDNCFKITKDPFVGTQLHILDNLCEWAPQSQVMETLQSMCRDGPIHRVI